MDGLESGLYFVEFAPRLMISILSLDFMNWGTFLFRFLKRNAKKLYFFTEEK